MSRDVTSNHSKPSERTDPVVLGAMAVSMLLWASAFVGIRAVTDDIDPGALAFGRLIIGSLALGTLLLSQSRARARMSLRQMALVIGSGLTWFAIYSVSLNTAERTVDAGVLGSSTYVVPVLAIGMGWLLLGEVVPPLAVVGGALCIGGVLIARSRVLLRPALRRRPAEG